MQFSDEMPLDPILMDATVAPMRQSKQPEPQPEDTMQVDLRGPVPLVLSGPVRHAVLMEVEREVGSKSRYLCACVPEAAVPVGEQHEFYPLLFFTLHLPVPIVVPSTNPLTHIVP